MPATPETGTARIARCGVAGSNSAELKLESSRSGCRLAEKRWVVFHTAPSIGTLLDRHVQRRRQFDKRTPDVVGNWNAVAFSAGSCPVL